MENERAGYNSFPNLDVTDGADFYQAMDSKIKTLLDTPSRALSDEQNKQF